jgi:conjugal transfer pilus assembly protein TraB
LGQKHVFSVRFLVYGVLLFLLIFLLTTIFQRKEPSRVTTKSITSSKDLTAPGSQIDPKSVWMTQSAEQIKALQQQLADLKGQLDQERKAREDENQKRSVLPPLPKVVPPSASKSPEPSSGGGAGSNIHVKPPSSNLGGSKKADSGPPPKPPEPPKPAAAVFDVSAISTENADGDKRRTYVPAGSFAKAVLLAGLDAPTGGQAQSDPHPILLRIDKNAILPNKYQYDIRECFVIGAGYGDISSERAFMRLENLSCIRNDGVAIDTAIKGYVAGEDGKAGVRGRLVTKQGQILANALLSGIASGVGRSIEQSSYQYNSTIYGQQSYIDPNKTLQAGLGSGVGKAMDRLAQYYISLAEKIFPVIEVDSGRSVEVVLTKGLDLDDNVFAPSGRTEFSEIWKRALRVHNKEGGSRLW